MRVIMATAEGTTNTMIMDNTKTMEMMATAALLRLSQEGQSEWKTNMEEVVETEARERITREACSKIRTRVVEEEKEEREVYKRATMNRFRTTA